MSKKNLLERLGLIRKIDVGNVPQLIDLDEPEEMMSEEKKWIRDVLIANTEREGKVAFVIDPESMFAGREKGGAIDTNKYMTIEDIYNVYNKRPKGAATVFVIDEFAGTLPGTLNSEMKRQAIFKLLDSAGVNVNDLIDDGLARIECLSGYLTTFRDKADSMQAEQDARIAELEEQLAALKEGKNEGRALREKQSSAVEKEIFRIKAILDFVTRKG